MFVKRIRIRSCILSLVLMVNLQTFNLQAQAGQSNAPVHNISIEFDLEANSFIASSRIELPAGSKLNLKLSHLNVSRITVDDQQQESVENTDYLYIPSSSEDREIIITYERIIPPDSASYSLVSKEGITLADNWYPVDEQEMIFKLTALIPPEFEAVSEAEEVITSRIGDRKQVHFRFPHPLFAINFVAGPYEITSARFGNEKDMVAYFFPEDRKLAAEYLDKAREYLERYEKMLGPYPYSRFSIVENRLPTGFAMPTYTLLGQSVVRLPFIVNTSLGHEVLHSWFGNGVRMSPGEGNWVEGLTTYLADQQFAAEGGRGVQYRKEQLVKYQSYVRPDMDLALRSFSNVNLGSSKGEPTRAVGYNKSAMFFHMLKNRVGEESFFNSLRDFYSRLQYKTGGWSDLQTSFENITGLELSGFFSQWLDRNDIPDFFIRNAAVRNNDGYPVLSFDIVQKNKAPYELKLPAVIKTAKEDMRLELSLKDSPSTFEIPLKSLPEKLVIDPGYDVMRVLGPAEIPATWSRFMGSAHKTIILSSEAHRARFKLLLEQVVQKDTHILLQDEVSDEDLAGHTLLFLGPESSVSRSLFAQTEHPAEGFTLDVRQNPLSSDQVAVLVSAADEKQANDAAAKLRHYGKYSYLSFKDGQIQEKKIQERETGLQADLISLPTGMETSKFRPFDDIIAKLIHYQVIYVGEVHTSYEDHLLQLEIIRALYEQDPDLAIGMEMFTRETQPALDRYLSGEIDEKSFLKESHYFNMWRFDYRYYRDIINFARHSRLDIIGLNLEKDIVSQVFQNGGPNSLKEDDLGTLPVNRQLDLPGYRERVEFAYLMHSGQEQEGEFSGFLQAQALWDETMAQTITDYLELHPDRRMVIIAGRGHVDRNNAIPPRVTRRLPVVQAVAINSTGNTSESQMADFVFFSSPASLSPFPVLGVMLEDTEDEEGVLVTATKELGHAEKAGIRKKDIILAIDSEPVNDIEDVKIAMLYKENSDSVTVKIMRQRFLGQSIMDVEVNLKGEAHPQHM